MDLRASCMQVATDTVGRTASELRRPQWHPWSVRTTRYLRAARLFPFTKHKAGDSIARDVELSLGKGIGGLSEL